MGIYGRVTEWKHSLPRLLCICSNGERAIEMPFDSNKPTLVIAGNGMVGHKLVELLNEGGPCEQWHIVVFCEEARQAYDRVNLSGYFSGRSLD